MGMYEMVELRRAMIDEVEVVLKGVVEKYDREVRSVGGVGEGGWPSYFPEEWVGRWPTLEGLKWIVWEREQVAGEEEGPFWRTASASIGGPEESYVYGYVSGRIIEWIRKVPGLTFFKS